MATLPESAGYGIGQTGTAEYPTTTYAVKDGRICGMTDGGEAIRQAIDIILHTERYRYQIYTSNFGVEFGGLVGKAPEYVMSMLKRRVTEALMTDERIKAVENFTFRQTGETLECGFDVRTVYGPVRTEVSL